MYCYEETSPDYEEEIRRIHLEIFFSIVIIIATCLVLYLAFERLKAYRENDFSAEKLRRWGRIGEFSILLILISVLYFTYLGWIRYREDPTDANLAFLAATILVLIATIVRYVTIIRSNGTNITGVEDIIG